MHFLSGGLRMKSFPATVCRAAVLTVISLSVLCSIGSATERGGLGFSVELLTYKSGFEDNTSLDVWCEIPLSHLSFAPQAEGLAALYEVSVVLFDSENQFLGGKSQVDSFRVFSKSEMGALEAAFSKTTFVLTPQKYRVIIIVEDLYSGDFARVEKLVSVPDYEWVLNLGDLHLSQAIKRAQKESSWNRNGWLIQPNPSRQFEPDDGAVYVYSEAYNLIFGVEGVDPGVISTYTVKNVRNKTGKTFEIPNIKGGSDIVLVAMIPIHDLRSGRYELILTVRDLASGLEAKKSAYFFVKQTDLLADSFEKSE